MPVLLLGASESGSFDSIEGVALLDTGSTTSGVKASVARRLRLEPRGKRPMSGIGGELQVERYVFRIGILGDGLPYIFEDLIGFELRESFVFDALIGMDIIRQTSLEMRRGRAILTLK